MRGTVLAVVGLVLAANASHAEVRVLVRGSRVDVHATAAPVSEVLDRLARETGMKVVYDGPQPRQVVTLTLADRSPADAVLAVLEGLGVNFALTSDPSGERVGTLMVAGAPPVVAAASGTRPAGPQPARRVPPGFQPPDADQQEVPEEPAVVPQNAPGADGTVPVPLPAAVTAPVQPTDANGQPQPPAAPPAQQFPVSPFAPQPAAPAASPQPQPGGPPLAPGSQPQVLRGIPITPPQ